MSQRILIIGGGMVGFGLSIALRRALPAVDVTILEARPLPTGNPDPLDTRASALNLVSREILDSWACWAPLLENCGVIRHIHVSNQRRFGSSLINPRDIGEDALGFVAENHHIGRVMKDCADGLGVVIEAPTQVAKVTARNVSPEVVLADGTVLKADLVIVADGAESKFRDQIGVAVDRRRTGQQAVVANVSFSGPQTGTAFERFTPQGPLALLPLKSTSPQSQRFNLVWSMSEDMSAPLTGGDDAVFLTQLMKDFGWRLGRATAVGKRSSWPLNRVRAREQTRGGVVIAGNAAHGIHPVAGQGLNLSLRDAATLAAVLKEGQSLGLPLGDAQQLRRYEQRVAEDQKRIIGATDLLSTLFQRRGPLLDIPRDAALASLDLIPPARRAIARQGTRAPLHQGVSPEGGEDVA